MTPLIDDSREIFPVWRACACGLLDAYAVNALIAISFCNPNPGDRDCYCTQKRDFRETEKGSRYYETNPIARF